MRILFIQTGGSIDKDYIPTKNNHGYAFTIEEPAVGRILHKAKIPETDYRILECLRKDSLDINDKDRQSIMDAVAAAEEDFIIITHGTDTIEVTARLLLSIPYKTIVLTGSMLPEVMKDSEADFNIGMAIGVVLSEEPGVYIILNGVIQKLT